MTDLIMYTQTQTQPERAVARHGFPLPLVGEPERDVRTLVMFAPLHDATFHVNYEGELFAVDRQVQGDVGPLLAVDGPIAKVAVFLYQPADLDALIGRQEPMILRPDEAAPESSVFVLGSVYDQGASAVVEHRVTIMDTYRRI